MDFIARAGSMIDRSHRVAGFMLLVAVIEFIMLITLLGQVTSLSNENQRLRENSPVYVVPGSEAGFYQPSNGELLMRTFTEYVAQALNTYTHVGLQKQYEEIQKFFTPEMLVKADAYYTELIRSSRQDERSAMLIVDPTSYTFNRIDTPAGEKGEFWEAKFGAERKNVIGGTVVDSVPLQVALRLKRVFLSQTNPFGFMVARYDEKILSDEPVLGGTTAPAMDTPR
jgi:hypothetical protein